MRTEPTRRRPRPHLRRRGFTLVELLMALLLFDGALFAVAGNAALLMRLHDTAVRRTAAGRAAASRIARVRAQGCPDPVADSASPAPGIREYWVVTAMGPATRLLVDSVAYDRRTHAAFVLRAAVVC